MPDEAAPTREASARTPAPKIDSTFRSGSLTAIGIMVGFSLGFLTRWAGVPGGWSGADYVALACMTPGIALQIVSLAMLLSVDSLELERYNRLVRIFLAGLILVAIGVLLAVFLDIAGFGQKLLSQ
ncbi:MAG: hypothetical protein ABWZ80_11015 [Beijerinckiaceae bacterium]